MAHWTQIIRINDVRRARNGAILERIGHATDDSRKEDNKRYSRLAMTIPQKICTIRLKIYQISEDPT